MCGIAGILRRVSSRDTDWSVLSSMSEALSHRGPDGHGYFASGPVGLAHRRLAIIDIEGGRQPMIDEGRGLALVYNGELYNFTSLRAELESRGVTFATRSDTEVLFQLAEVRSFDWAARLNGMFAFALWSEPARKLLLARDRLGIKPLFYTRAEDEFLFASEIKSLLRHPRVSRRVNAGRIPEHLAFRCLAGNETMFEGIYQAPPGHVLEVSSEDLSLRFHQFWPDDRRTLQQTSHTDAQVRQHTFERLTDSVRRQLVSDVPVGTYLSGGVDSSLVTSLVRTIRAEQALHTFSVGFEEPDYDESRFAERVATMVGATHHAMIVTEPEYLAQLDDTVRQLDEPLNHAHSVQLQLLSHFAKSFVTVVLTGEGADELFGGYPRLQIPLLAGKLEWLPRVVSSGVRELSATVGLRRIAKLFEASTSRRDAVINSARFVPGRDLAALGVGTCFGDRETAFADIATGEDFGLDEILAFDQRTYLPSILSRLDKTSMAAGIECRVPFLDNEMIDCSQLVPEHLKIRAGRENKVVLKQIAQLVLPYELVYRRKVGFGTPLAKWFRNPAGLGRRLDHLLEPSGRTRDYLDVAGAEALIGEHRRGTHDHSEALWGLVSLEMWFRLVVDGTSPFRGQATESWKRELARTQPLSFCGGTAIHSGLAL